MLDCNISYEKPLEVIVPKEKFIKTIAQKKHIVFDNICMTFKTTDILPISDTKFQIKPFYLTFIKNKQPIDKNFIEKYINYFNNHIPVIEFENVNIRQDISNEFQYHRLYFGTTNNIKFTPIENSITTFDIHTNKLYLTELTLPEILNNQTTSTLLKHISIYDLLQQAYQNHIFSGFKYNPKYDKFNVLCDKISLKHLFKDFDFNNVAYSEGDY